MPNLRSKTWTTTTPANVEDAQYWEDHLISDEAAAKAAAEEKAMANTRLLEEIRDLLKNRA